LRKNNKVTQSGPYSQEEWASDCTTVTGRPHDESTLCDDEPTIARLVSDTSSLLPMMTLYTKKKDPTYQLTIIGQ
jgi:hypothetical protein